jgi:hypothetical protein
MLHQQDVGWANPKVLAILAVVFLCGSACGAAIMREYIHYRFMVPAAHDFVYHGRRVAFETLKSDLNLSSTQEQTVEQVLDDFAKYYQNLEEQREDVTEAGKRRIYAVLDPDQKRRFAGLLHEPPPKTATP